MPRGTVKSFDKVKGFGYITPEGGDSAAQGIYVNASAIAPPSPEPRELIEGQTVFYQIVKDPRGHVQAAYVRVVESV
ncbi:cold-shock protein [Pandoraea sputorum]|uniref:cold-shock protein n=1 Tax=Pandoraea sputorum TaxID=93222 RepID=UPI002F4219D1